MTLEYTTSYKSKLQRAYGRWLLPKGALAVTFTANRDLCFDSFKVRLREFHRQIDQRRLGGRFYQQPIELRLNFLLAPEHLKAGNPHFHGLLIPPMDDLARFGHDGLMEAYQAVWRGICPSGNLDIQPTYDAEGWLNYASKEHSITLGDKVIWSLNDFVSPRAPVTGSSIG